MQEPREEGDGEESQAAPTPWKPNEDYLQVLTGMGISAVAAEKALFYTDNRSPDLAAAWLFENSEADLETSLAAEAGISADSAYDDVYKMAFVVNTSLNMGAGKLASQVAHAAIGLHRLLLQNENKYGEMVLQWTEDGETKIVLRGNSTQHLVELERKALQLGLPTYLVQDAGRTQIPSGSTTVLCLMGRLDIVDEVTGSLKLL
ncbi:probable peptidyl-tRNA hydrolase 2 [Parasteatoda tepidariorum]|uniref:peptidyl-tRNA hydrolase n=1 Tax=Parasteatoda tepidariorum TaxID=114398 RepID=A0A2L2Y623_PARTP|nr:probable peptidyl-tRNA hydrolase 2 [Parasteatoda tepidariorum]XP_042899176.1 probable peptidyl-tRNA hydrolase 2 [Parasteatoda tepidariorum]